MINYFIKILHLWIYNSSGFDMLLYLSIAVDVCTRTLTRILTILVCMGYVSTFPLIDRLGISRASINDTTLKLIVFAILYFCVNLWDSLMSTQPQTDSTLSKARIYITAGYASSF